MFCFQNAIHRRIIPRWKTDLKPQCHSYQLPTLFRYSGKVVLAAAGLLLPHFSRGSRSLSQIPTWSIVIHHELSGSHSILKDNTLGQTTDSPDKYHWKPHVITSAVQLNPNNWPGPKTSATRAWRQFADPEEQQSDGQGAEEWEIKSPVTKCKVQQKRVFVS